MMQVLRHGSMLQLVRLEMSLNDFSNYLKIGIGTNGRFEITEKLGQKLINSDFNIDLSLQFVRAVCLWGSDPRRGAKIIKRNSPEQIASALRRAHLLTGQDKIVESLHEIVGLKGLSVSFGSKHLKFLDLGRHVVLDSILSERLGYTRDEAGVGYMNWRAACQNFLKIISYENIAYPGTGNSWRISDVEMAIFNKIRKE